VKLYLDNNDTLTQELLDRSEATGAAAIVFTIDTPADGNRHRANRFGVGTG
jgi:isopentenyl diphosphate isomerase/L-lactate dehydrogenase-like FMN-dependent dehydrogenase